MNRAFYKNHHYHEEQMESTLPIFLKSTIKIYYQLI